MVADKKNKTIKNTLAAKTSEIFKIKQPVC